MTMRQTRSKDAAFRALLPESATEDVRLLDAKPDYLLFEARAFGGDVKKSHSFVWVHSALADGSKRGRLFGTAIASAHAEFAAEQKTVTAKPHTTDAVATFCVPNLVRTADGKVYRIESTADVSADDAVAAVVTFQLTDAIGSVEFSALRWW